MELFLKKEFWLIVNCHLIQTSNVRTPLLLVFGLNIYVINNVSAIRSTEYVRKDR